VLICGHNRKKLYLELKKSGNYCFYLCEFLSAMSQSNRVPNSIFFVSFLVFAVNFGSGLSGLGWIVAMSDGRLENMENDYNEKLENDFVTLLKGKIKRLPPEELKQRIISFMQEQKICTLATCAQNIPR
jgi:hypothetical protein